METASVTFGFRIHLYLQSRLREQTLSNFCGCVCGRGRCLFVPGCLCVYALTHTASSHHTCLPAPTSLSTCSSTFIFLAVLNLSESRISLGPEGVKKSLLSDGCYLTLSLPASGQWRALP
ncbi:hypothetical protein J4Q44_G00096100 [Coregonus suidteri]|uniref:Uncharacterized protein n=1 Tax=Coregonus suidteri TaxID=861788 RepID=A0AAN8LXA1_9TELE